MSIQLKEVPASQGLQWVKSGLQLALKQPLGFVSLLGLMLTMAMVLMVLPIVGAIALMSLMPVMWMLYMLAAQQATKGERINPWQLILLMRQSFMLGTKPKNWMILGLLYIGATFVVMLIAGLLGPDMDALGQAIEQASKSTSPDALQDPVLIQSVLWRFALSWPIALAFWHTPALLFWGGTQPVKAVFFSLVVCWRNLGAFVVYALSWALLILGIFLLLEMLTQWLEPSIWTQMLSISAGLWVASAFYASLYATVSDCLQFDAKPSDNELSLP